MDEFQQSDKKDGFFDSLRSLRMTRSVGAVVGFFDSLHSLRMTWSVGAEVGFFGSLRSLRMTNLYIQPFGSI